MKHTVLTTFHQAGYDEYGRRCIETFIQHWPKDVTLYVVLENVNLDPTLTADNVVYMDQDAVNSALAGFKAKHRDNPHATGYDPRGRDPIKKYLWDAVRFSNKVYAVTGMYEILKNSADHMIWLDADTVTHCAVPVDFLDHIAPKNDQLTAYLNRSIYPECGWVGYNMNHPSMAAFMERFQDVYESGEFLTWIESHDSYVFWQVMKEFEAKGCDWRALGDNNQRGHVFINSELGQFMDHLKGPRKSAGKSRIGDLLQPRQEAWWQEIKK